jgi:hypothetical protein
VARIVLSNGALVEQGFKALANVNDQPIGRAGLNREVCAAPSGQEMTPDLLHANHVFAFPKGGPKLTEIFECTDTGRKCLEEIRRSSASRLPRITGWNRPSGQSMDRTSTPLPGSSSWTRCPGLTSHPVDGERPALSDRRYVRVCNGLASEPADRVVEPLRLA